MKNKHFLFSLTHALDGFVTAFRSERNVRIHLVAMVLVTFAGCYCRLSQTEWVLLLICFIIVMAFELVNSAMEALCDQVNSGWHPNIKRIKDMAAAATLWAALGSVLIGALVFIPHLITFF